MRSASAACGPTSTLNINDNCPNANHFSPGGAWAGIGLAAFEAIERGHPTTALEHNILFVTAGIVFLFLPAKFLVCGTDAKPFGKLGPHDPARSAESFQIFGRMLCWFLAAGAVMLAFSSFD